MAVAQQIQARPITEIDLMALGEGVNVEVIDGRVIYMTPAGGIHGEVSMNIGVALFNHVRDNKLGKVFADQTTFVLEGKPEEIRVMRVPDKSFIANENLPAEGTPTGYFYQAPDLAVEAVSSSESLNDTMHKINDYLRAGTQAVWVIIPKTRQIMVHTPEGITLLNEYQTLEGGVLLPGLSIPVASSFA